MAKVQLNPIIERMQGQLGDLVFRQYGNSVIVGRKADPTGRPVTPAQQATRNRFREATLYGRMALADATLRPRYEARARTKKSSLFSLTVADYLTAPVVHDVDLSAYTGQIGSPVVVQATDDFEVCSVLVEIQNEAGEVLEAGEAVQEPPQSSRWVYAATTEVAAGQGVTVTAVALDHPGNDAALAATKTL